MPRLIQRPLRLLALTWLLGVSSSAMAVDLRLAVAANFTDTARELIAAFADTTGLEASASYGSTGKLYAQIRNGAPFDVFLAADSRRPELLEQQGMGLSGSRFTYARGTLVLWSPEPGTLAAPEAWLAAGDFKRLAMANPKTAPYGLAAQQVLAHLGLWQPLQPKLVRGESIAQAFQFVATSNAQAGFVALAQVIAWPGPEGALWRIPREYYSPVNQQAILLSHGRENDAAHQWLTFLHSPRAQRIIQQYGYDTSD